MCDSVSDTTYLAAGQKLETVQLAKVCTRLIVVESEMSWITGRYINEEQGS